MELEKNQKSTDGKAGEIEYGDVTNRSSLHTFWKVVSIQLFCASTIIAGLWIVPGRLGVGLNRQPVETLQIALTLALPVSLTTSSLLPSPLPDNSGRVPPWWAILRGLVSLPVGVLIAAFMAIVFGAPLSLQFATKTLYWAALMSVLVVVPGATVLGTSWPNWIRIFACTEPARPVEITICIPAHGAAIGAWFGAWPMPLDWERPWQEWPVCCTYGAVGGYLVSLIGSLVWTYVQESYFRVRSTHKKQD